jgi:radial spoke head protein 4A
LAGSKKDDGLVTLRFWGKILGSAADYYVAEATMGGGDLPEGEDAAVEPLGTGANTYTYFVTNDLCSPWVQLPFIRPREITAARTIKKMVTGDPQAKVVTHPFFDGKEEVLLRAQIAQITADTILHQGPAQEGG